MRSGVWNLPGMLRRESGAKAERNYGTLLPRPLIAVGIAVASGLLEAAWTGINREGPTNVWLGVFSLFAIFFVFSYPKVWWIPGMAIIEEWVHLIFGYGILNPDLDRIFNHWSHTYLGFPLMPYITFPALTLVGEILHRKMTSAVRHRLDEKSQRASHSVRLLFRSEERETWAESPSLPDLNARVVNPPVQALHVPVEMADGVPLMSGHGVGNGLMNEVDEETSEHGLKGKSRRSEYTDD